MANADYLVLAVGVGALIISITVGAVLYQAPPQADIRLETSKESYRLGEWVDVSLENHGPFVICTRNMWPWNIMRHVDDEWHGVAIIFASTAEGSIWPGETLRWGWVAENDPYLEEWGLPPFAEVLPGEYRFGFDGWLCGEMAPEPIQGVTLFAYFELAA